MIRLYALCALAAAAFAQQPQNASITGIVKDSVAGRPLADYTVSTTINATYVGDVFFSSAEARQVSATTDAQGRYKLSDLPPGDYRVSAQPPRSFAGRLTRHLSINGRDLENIDFAVPVAGSITGRVLDENREPVPGMFVKLISREYYSGVLGYFVKNLTTTDDRGVYVMDRIDAGQPYLLMAERDVRQLPPRSDAPLDPALRRRVPMRTFYPNSPDREGGSPIVVRPGERREGVDIEIKKSASFCVEGTASGLAGPAELYASYEAAQPAYGTSSSGGMFGVGPSTKTGPDGKFRFCGLSPGTYRLAAFDGYQGAVNRAVMPIEIRDRDLAKADLMVGPGLAIEGEVVWDGAAPETPPTVKVSITLNPLLRSPVANERPFARADIPGAFSITGLLPADYALRAIIGGGLYIKDIQYAGQSVHYAPFRAGNAAGNAGLRVIVGRDGARINARVQDKDGNPLGDMRVLAFPAEISSEAMLQAALVSGQTNQSGTYRSQALRPGKYFVVATQDRINDTPDSIDALWRSRARFQEIELAPNGTAQATLTPVSLK